MQLIVTWNNLISSCIKALIISHDGASGDYPGSSDLAYQKAIDDGADIIDCSVQLSKDGVAFCLPSVDLTGTTTAASAFLDRSTKIPEIQDKNGIFSFDLTWSEIQLLKRKFLMKKMIFTKMLVTLLFRTIFFFLPFQLNLLVLLMALLFEIRQIRM